MNATLVVAVVARLVSQKSDGLPSALVFAIATAAFVGMTACDHRPQGDVQATATHARHERDGWNAEEQQRLARLTREIGALEKRQAFLEQQRAEQLDTIARSERRIQDLKRDLQQRKTETNAYIDQHELHVACAYAKQVASGEGEYSEKTRNCARIASMYCAVAMLSPTFRRNVAAVKKHVDEAEERAQLLKKEISSEQQNITAGRAMLPATEESIDRIAGEIAERRQQLKVRMPSSAEPLGAFTPSPQTDQSQARSSGT